MATLRNAGARRAVLRSMALLLSGRRFDRCSLVAGLRACVAVVVASFAEQVAFAQQAAPNVAQNVSSGRSYYFEGTLIVVMFGAALFAVCRSSFRR